MRTLHNTTAALVAAASWRAGAGGAAGIAGMGWLMLNGFVVHQYGDLGWDGNRDVSRLAVLLVGALVASSVHAVLIRTRRHRALEPVVPRSTCPDAARLRRGSPA